MADTTKIGPIFRGANGGLSDDLFTGIKNSFYYSNDMEIREDAKSIFPKPVPAYADDNKKIEISVTSAIAPSCAIWSFADNAWIMGFGRLLYKVSGTTATQQCQMPSGQSICDIEVFNGYIYVATLEYLYYVVNDGYSSWADMASSTSDSSDQYGRCSKKLGNNGYHPLYGTDTILCIGDKNNVRKIRKETFKTVEDGIKLQSNYVVRFIDELGGYVRTTAVEEPFGSEILLWDKVSDAPTEVIPLQGYTATQSAIYNGYHYLLTNKGLGLVNGYQYYLLKKADGEVGTSSHNGMCVYDDKLYFIANDGLYIYGAKNKNYADVLNMRHHVEEGYILGAIAANKNAILTTRGGKSDGGGWLPARVGVNSGMATNGEMQTMCYFGTSMSEIKQSMYLRVGYHIPKQGTESGNIHIYYRTEADATTDSPDDWKWHEVTKPDGLYADWDMRSPFATTLKLNCRFQWIQFKFVLTNCVYDDNGTTKTKDTNLYSADLYYNTMLD